MEYRPVTLAVADALRRIVGGPHVLFGNAEANAKYAHDEVPEPKYAHPPEVVVLPESAEEVAAVLRLANEERVPVTPRGAGTGLSGGAVPVCGGIVLLSDRMDRILEIDPANLACVVEPGVVTNRINEALEPHGLFYAGYPLSEETCCIGGNVAENAGGAKAVKYGVTGRYVIGLQVVTPTGRIVELGGKLVKDVTGYDLIPLLVGSEGTLAVFTRITLRLLPRPKAVLDLLAAFDTVEQAIEAVPAMMTHGGFIPTAIEFVEAAAWSAACDYLERENPCPGGAAILILSVDGDEEAHVARQRDVLAEFCRRRGAARVYAPGPELPGPAIWKIRSSIGKAYGRMTPRQSSEDLVVPIAAIPRLVAGMKAIGRRHGVLIPCYGHAGDGNIHTRVLSSPDWDADRWERTLPAIQDELYALTAGLGGRLSAEHGIGHKRKAFLPRFLSADAIDLMRAIKRAWDPRNILNPGKVFDLEA